MNFFTNLKEVKDKGFGLTFPLERPLSLSQENGAHNNPGFSRVAREYRESGVNWSINFFGLQVDVCQQAVTWSLALVTGVHGANGARAISPSHQGNLWKHLSLSETSIFCSFQRLSVLTSNPSRGAKKEGGTREINSQLENSF